jgi:hypothetical protein
MGGFRVAVIGAGISGAFFSDFLRGLANESRVSIDAYESSARIGGRALDTTAYGEAADVAVDLGAAMYIEQNHYMASSAASLGLETVGRSTTTKGRSRLLVLGNEGTPVFTEAAFSAQSMYRMASHFGLRDLKRLTSRGKDFITNFSRLYGVQQRGEAFDTVAGLLASAGMADVPRLSCTEAAGQALSSASSPVATELISALMRNNYGQSWAPSGALCCFTAVAPLAAGGSKAAHRIVGGNARLAEALLRRSGAVVHLNTTVTAVTATSRGRYSLELSALDGAASADSIPDKDDGFASSRVEAGSAPEALSYDYVVLAAPCPQADDLATAVDSPDASPNLLDRCARLPFQVVHTTLVYGLLDPAALKSSLTAHELNGKFSDILIADGAPLPYSSIGLQLSGGAGADAAAADCAAAGHAPPADGLGVPRWKIFSKRQLTADQLGQLFLCHGAGSIVRHEWAAPGAYPLSRPWAEGSAAGGSFVLHAGGAAGGLVLHPSAMESATSAMEVMAVAARNAALLVGHDLVRRGAAGAMSPRRAAAAAGDNKEEL